MARRKKIYRRLPGKGLAAFQHVRLFQGPDHLLQVASSGYSESYKRFYFRDIQSVTVRKTHIGKIWNAGFGFAVLVFGLPAFDLAGGASIALWCIAGFFALLLVGNLIIGPSCACYIRTAVQTERLAAVRRISTARRLLRRIRPMIEAVQGSVPREEITIRLRGSAAPAPEVEAPPRISEAVNSPEAPPQNSSQSFG